MPTSIPGAAAILAVPKTTATEDTTPTTTWDYVSITSSSNLGAMVTPMVFPPGCTDIYRFDTSVLGMPAWWPTTFYTGGCAMSSCCPFGRVYTTALAWYSSYYSPAVCPQSYVTCPGPWEVQSGLPRNEHVRFCCPTGYACPLWSGVEICETLRRAATTGVVVGHGASQVVLSTETLPAQTQATVWYEYAYPLQIRWKDSDWATVLTAGTSGTMPAIATSSSTTTGAGGAGDAPAGGLSTGGAVAIAVAVSVIGTVAAVVAILWARRRRRRRRVARGQNEVPPMLDGQNMGWGYPSKTFEAGSSVSEPRCVLYPSELNSSEH